MCVEACEVDPAFAELLVDLYSGQWAACEDEGGAEVDDFLGDDSFGY